MDKDEPIDRLLARRARQERGVAPPGGCLEPETIAAWMDGTLPVAERSIAEMHAADCERCLAILATVAKTSPVLEIHPRPGWLSLRWLVPAATTAVALIAWFLVWPDADLARREAASTKIAGPESAAAPQSAPVESPASPPAAGRSAEAVAPPSGGPSATPVPAGRAGARSNPLRQEGFQKAAPPPAAEEVLRDQVESRRADNTVRESAASTAPAPTVDTIATLRTPPPPPASVAGGAGRGGPPQPTPAAPPAPAAPPPPRSVGEAALPQADATGALKESADPRVRTMARQLAQPPFVIRVPDSRVQWRVSGALVERSDDDGRSWQAQAVGATVGLAAGSAPSDRVCWIVGRAGTVLLTVDGERWRRLAFPDTSIDLIGVLARNADIATITTAAGRTYQTTDRGRTWVLQGLTPAPF